MKISVIKSHNETIYMDWVCKTIKDVLCGLKMHHGKELTDSLLTENYKYILMNQGEPDGAIVLDAAVIGSSLAEFDTLIITRDIEGEIPAAAVAAAMTAVGVTGVTATSVSVLVVTALINVGLSLALNAVMSLLSPTPEFSSDPAFAQQKQSALFNGAPMIREQGGIVPLILGNPFCGGVLISSGITTEEV
jgi:predicted phage tail protein